MQEKINCHTHTKFSYDGIEEPEEIIIAAINCGISHLCFTDHIDISPLAPSCSDMGILKSNHNFLTDLKDKYKDKIYINAGIECGFTGETESELCEILGAINYDYVINSVHVVDGNDCFFKEYFENKTKTKAYVRYFEQVIKSLDAKYKFDAVGHIGYVERSAPYENKKLNYEDFKDYYDIILKKIIARNLILEINTSVYKLSSPTIPDVDILKRHKELGGKYVTFASDAHKIANLLSGYDNAVAAAKTAGFEYFTVIEKCLRHICIL